MSSKTKPKKARGVQPKTGMPKIAMEGVTKSFGDKQVLRGINIEVAAEESLAIIGTSGCGKSVTLKCLLGLLRADGGSIKVDGEERIHAGRHQLEAMRRRFGMTFQFGALFDSLPIWENVTFRLRQQQTMTRQQARDLAAETITQLGLAAHVIDQYPAELSGGMQKRVALARAIADKPEILLFDEPTSGLDPITGGVIDRLILDSVRRLGATALTISHDMASVRRIADKVAMVHNGVIIWCGPASEMDDTGIPEVHQFVHGLADGPLTLAAQAEARGD
ncbi:MAG: ATP-binding cassette domain-containing protein [Pseudomonadota bacterium]|nr:ATP-binding cassette domain-containing protein [Pseudomonadota bacterium]